MRTCMWATKVILIRSSQTTFSSLSLFALFDYDDFAESWTAWQWVNNATDPQQFARFALRSQQKTFARHHAGQLTIVNFNFVQLKFLRNLIMRSSSDSHKAHNTTHIFIALSVTKHVRVRLSCTLLWMFIQFCSAHQLQIPIWCGSRDADKVAQYYPWRIKC